MRPFTFLLLIQGLAQVVAADPQADSYSTAAFDNEKVESAVTRMQGKWVCVWDQRDGSVDERQVGTVFVFDGTEITHQFPDGHSSRWEYRLHPDTSPKGIDWRSLNGARGFEPGIFWLMGDTLVFCDGSPIEKRPEHFGDGSHLYVLRRISADQPPATVAGPQQAESDGQLSIRQNAWVEAHDFVVSARSNKDNPVATRIQLQEGEVFIIEPDKSAKWGAHGSDGPLVDYSGLGRTDSLLSLCFRVGNASAPVIAGRPITVISPGELELYCQDDQPWDNIGQVALKVIRLKTNK